MRAFPRRVSTSLAVVFGAALSICGVTALAEEPARRDVAAELLRYYADGQQLPQWKDALQSLSSSDTASALRAAEYVRALLVQSNKDEKSGAAPWRATPFSGSSGENPAILLRQ